MTEDQKPAERVMEPFDALMYRSQDDPRARSDMMAVFVLGQAPDWDRFVATFDRASRLIPVLRQRVVEPPLPFLLPHWVVDPDFDLRYHVRRIRLPEPGTWRQLLSALEPLLMAPLDRARPLWEFTLIEGLEGGRAAYVSKLNHALTDGIGGQQWMKVVFDASQDSAQEAMPPQPVPLDITPSELLAQSVRRAPRAAIGGAVRLTRSEVALARTLATKPGTVAREANSYLQSFRRVLAPPRVEPSPLMRRRSLRRRLISLDVDLLEFKAAAKNAGGSINDGLLSAVAGALRIYHEKLGVPVDRLPVAIPISLRTADDPVGGNRWAGARLALPVGQADPASRIQLIREMVIEARAEPAANALSLVAPVLARIPSALFAAFAGEVTATHDLQISNVPGSPDPLFLAGAPVEQCVSFGPLPGPGVMIVMMSYQRRGYIGVNLDPAAVTEPELFEDCLQEGIQEVLALAAAPARKAAGGRRRLRAVEPEVAP